MAGGTPAASWPLRSDAAVLERGRRRLADVVEQRAEHHRVLLRHGQIVDALTRAVHHHQRVNPHVAFRVPLGILRTVDQRVQLGPEAFDDAEIAREGEADRGARRLAQQLFDFTPDAFARQIVERDGAAQIAGCRIERAVEARRELHRAQHAQAVFAERPCIDRAQDAAFEVGAAVVRIEIFVGERIPRDRVDREVAAAGRFLDREVRVAGHLESPCPRPTFDSRRGSDTSRSATL